MTRISMAQLMATEFRPIQYVIPGIIPEGLTILAAPPKVGKSWMVLDLAYQLANGGEALSAVPIDQERPVLYLALEDTPRRLQDRLLQLEASDIPERLYFQTTVDPGKVLEEASSFMAEHAEDSPVVIVDTLGKVAPPTAAGESDYQRDYRVGGSLKAVADMVPGGAVIVVHHTRKAGSDDFLDSVSGTQGLAGSADSIIVLRRDRNESNGSLSVTSRDAVEGEYAVHRNGVRWALAGGALTAAAIALAKQRVSDGLGGKASAIVQYVTDHPEGVRATDISVALDMSEKDAGTYLLRAFKAGRIARVARGLYGPVGNVGTVGNDVINPTLPTLPTPIDVGYCGHGITLGVRCTPCGGQAVAS
ncbi:AAA family ATPase [Microbacterium testaceum]|uniref:AAA family ATPase n=1 Tax=Microbacterium testaceum TaxID=2033 RepID=UPI0007346916|nr:AAA family ATPase [Microbacterium testaceum]